jgi:hypothetical protein
MNDANVKLSKNELALVTDMQVILTKNLIIQKVYTLFGELSSHFQARLQAKEALLPAEALAPGPKIYKGEQYLQLPYVILDCPRFYTKNDVLAVRCVFWWGNFFSISLHLAGGFLQQRQTRLTNWMLDNRHTGWYVSNGNDAWQHHFEANNYIAMEECIETEGGIQAIEQREFIKLAKRLPLQQWDDAFCFFTAGFRDLEVLLEN